ncbi:MAG: ectonucleotide pyrophosphatase/phosphodiesterase [Clostridiaceae bacterium]|nr:ectonucleotide pyrophosphatase/phosphodiesterase [Clostridiaceae bacterium]
MLIVLSEDALVLEDLDYLKTRPNFARFLQNAARIDTLRTIYPTVTYPVHTSVSTGCYPDRHGITTNELFIPGQLGNPWHWFARDIAVPTIFDAAHAAGLSTAAVFWPVTGCHPSIDYLVDEYWSQCDGDDLRDVFLRSGTSPDVFDRAVAPNLHLLRGHERQHPAADHFVLAVACDILRAYRPDVLFIHPAQIDGFRHRYGLFNEQIDRALDEADRHLGALCEALEAMGLLETANIVVMSDHGQIPIQRSIALNVLLAEQGFIRTDESGHVIDYDAYIQSAGLSAQVHLKNPARYTELETLLAHWQREGIYGISRVFTKTEAASEYRLAGDFEFVLETDGFTAFNEAWTRPLVHPIDTTDWRYGHATHGYLPDIGPQPTFVAAGPAFRAGASVPRRPIVDTTATFACVLGIGMPGIDGVPVEDILI